MVHGTESVTDFDVGTGMDRFADVFLGCRNRFYQTKPLCQISGNGRRKGTAGTMNVSGGNGIGREQGRLNAVARRRK